MNDGMENEESKQRRVNVNWDKDLVPLNIDGSVMAHEIYMKHWVDICISRVKKHV